MRLALARSAGLVREMVFLITSVRRMRRESFPAQLVWAHTRLIFFFSYMASSDYLA